VSSLTSYLLSSTPVVDDAPRVAREKFGNQKAISSDMYFGRNAYDPDAVNEAQSRLQSFQGATSISSNQYFGREDEDELGGGDRGSDAGLLGDGSLGGLEIAAKDAIAKVLANPDVQNVGESIRSGALKVRLVPKTCLSVDVWLTVCCLAF
jgi:ADP-ribosylation factor GTPase-activating protein 2/3